MSDQDRQTHWQNIYTTTGEAEVSWFEESPAISLDLIRSTGVGADASIIDVGGGASRLVDALVNKGFEAITVLDLSEKALATAKARLGASGAKVQWVVADVTTWKPSTTYDVWHDRATSSGHSHWMAPSGAAGCRSFVMMRPPSATCAVMLSH
jgi:2-polyprenyl-3-methyl-5-hydroxy-6-metoxy-1,4-benzoquinol methylase